MLRRILAFTVGVERLDRSVAAWERALGWSSRGETTVPTLVADRWGAPTLAGRRAAVLAAPTGEPSFVRFIETGLPPPPAVAGLLPQPSLGWAAIEIAVEDPYALAAELARAGTHAPFQVAVAPRPIPWDADIHAMQALGPDREMLYLTKLPAERPMLDLVPARCRVDRAFIAVLGVRSLEASLRFYADRLGTPVLPRSTTVVQVINDAFGLAADHRTALGIVKLPREFLIEIDEMPANAAARVGPTGGLPPGIAMVTLETDATGPTGVIAGPDGEWLELLAPLADPLPALLWHPA
jgi:catechol 2,3-dioxygenase-like lactoylglutathione lyase family enzyme